MVADDRASAGEPVGRRIVLGLLAAGGLGVVGGSRVSDGLARLLAPLESRDPTGLIALFPLGNAFRFYSVTGSVPTRTADSYRLTVSGLVEHVATYRVADLQAMPQTRLVGDFQCVTGWRVLDVHWAGVRLSELLERAGPMPAATAVRFYSFDGTYTESMTLQQARRRDIIVALKMLGSPVTHEHGGPVRIYAASMYGYKSIKWLSRIELTHGEQLGYWETRSYPHDATIRN
jgi:DMSO/TMAO reductase YedYZ molybdopterin-dependent catalytic subunit